MHGGPEGLASIGTEGSWTDAKIRFEATTLRELDGARQGMRQDEEETLAHSCWC